MPKLKALPYWGNPKDRATLRKFWSKKEISYDQDAPFHVLITSYQLVSWVRILPDQLLIVLDRFCKTSSTSNV